MIRHIDFNEPIELRQLAGDHAVLRGHAAVFYDPADEGRTTYELKGGLVERIAPGAFRDSIASDQDVLALYNHNSDFPLGRQSAGTLRLAEDQRGLRFEIDLPNTTVGRDLRESVCRGDILGCSFGFRSSPGGSKMIRKGDRVFRELRRLLPLLLLMILPLELLIILLH